MRPPLRRRARATLTPSARWSSRFQERANFGTWLYRIAVNCSLDLMRRRRRVAERSDALDGESAGGTPLVAANLRLPDGELWNSELRRIVASAMEALSP